MLHSLILLFALAPPWKTSAHGDTLQQRFPAPPGFTRVDAPAKSFAAFLRDLPLFPGKPDVVLYDGREKRNQTAQLAVVDIDVGERDLQQCADAVLRLYAEHAYAQNEPFCFTLTSGDAFPWSRWSSGERPQITGNTITWRRESEPDASHASFRRYLDTLFTYAGTLSISRDLTTIADSAPVEPGDVFVVGGSPGHAVIVVDVAVNAQGERRFMLAQSYMPAQQIHVLRAGPTSPWFSPAVPLVTPEWIFPAGSHRRLTKAPCK